MPRVSSFPGGEYAFERRSRHITLLAEISDRRLAAMMITLWPTAASPAPADSMATRHAIRTIQQNIITQTDARLSILADESQLARVKRRAGALFLRTPATRAIWRLAGSPGQTGSGLCTIQPVFLPASHTTRARRSVCLQLDGGPCIITVPHYQRICRSVQNGLWRPPYDPSL